ncbi:DNA ligase D [Bacillus sp. ISL-51]|uniref:DNA ligase D n=1 Tax=Bacteria TaxID=2 RepID=UPI001BE83C20|nr:MULTISPECIES: DNA ligase D [Bacteria]MBT2573634.1 DNA ligase D [Bacillus sp. ISL-51]MBT2633898.1 DNA ligase D [Bacillus sp. ISL-26]MBT2712513.1 DNA ligase D [Pseudomonas sp. ISL-88]
MVLTMQPILTSSPPEGSEWRYEVKYDGFRCLLHVNAKEVTLTSRNGQPLTSQFPEITLFAAQCFQQMKDKLPLTLDGELVYLINPYRADFERIQIRGRLKRAEAIEKMAAERPCRFLAFDLLELAGAKFASHPYSERKQMLFHLLAEAQLPASPHHLAKEAIQYIPEHAGFDPLWNTVVRHDGEGIVAKKTNSKWIENKRSPDWQKYKHMKTAHVLLTGFNPKNGYVTASVLKDGKVIPVASVSHGMQDEEKNAVRTIMETHGKKLGTGEYTLDPSICMTVRYLTVLQDTLREVSFVSFQFGMDWTACTYKQLVLHSKTLHPKLQFTSLDKVIFKKRKKTKEDFICYIVQISDFLLPFLKDRAVTVIRYPHGAPGESFFQKNKPDYTPDFISSVFDGSHEHIVCNDMSTLLWLANQLALEFHVPFQTIHSERPSEIVIDLDPPSRDDFLMAVQAAHVLKQLFESFGITPFPKLSGNKGIQLYIPLSPEAFTYDDTRRFTMLIADYCVRTYPDLFTTERFIKNRNGRLYLDYLQHAEGKTIISPYSTRGNELGTVAAPLYWNEVNTALTPDDYTIDTVIERVKKQGDPFYDFYRQPQDEPLSIVLEQIKKKS